MHKLKYAQASKHKQNMIIEKQTFIVMNIIMYNRMHKTQAITRINRCKPTKTSQNCFYSCGLDKQWYENSLLSSDDEMIFTKQI